MPNLYCSIHSLLEFYRTKKPIESQRLFILKIVNGDSERSSLHDIILYRKKDQLAKLRKIIQQEIHTSSWNNFNYIRLLKRVSKDIRSTQQTERMIGLPWEKKSEPYKKHLKIFNNLYSITHNKFRGTLMLPIMQALDPRLGNSQGECFGYVTKWAVQLYQRKSPFGIRFNSDSLFMFKPSLWRNYSDLNHLAPLTADISLYQTSRVNLNSILTKFPIMQGIRKRWVQYNPSIDFIFYTASSKIAEKLVEHANKKPQVIYNLNLHMSFFMGHALGFCKIDNNYHFMDANLGWFRFSNDKDFKDWLPFYFKCMEYDRLFSEYSVNTYSLTSSKASKEPFKLKPLEILLLPILVPIVLIYLTIFFIKRLVVDSFAYLFLKTKNLFSTKENFESESNLSRIPSEIFEKSLPKSLEPLDLAVQTSKKIVEKDVSSELGLSKIVSIVDTPLKDLAQVQKRALTNTAFKSKESFFSKNKWAAKNTGINHFNSNYSF